ncbi:hypothetical protein C1H46_028886 [Malus baccata]|uniref:Uncharacterized protein n=1 Tax=Malus baccata TaxID=106549 RepID=A0A540LGF6_MALBA|nr:hypothetical protein C1H46_028886 [Malus baccata]
MPAALKVTNSIVDRISQCRSSSRPLMPKFVPKRPFGAKSGSPLKRLATMKSNKVPMLAKMAPKPVPSATKINSSAEKNETIHTGSREESTKSVSGEASKIYMLLKPYLLEDMDVCAKFVDGIKVVGPSSFTKHTIEYRMTALLAIMQKMAILAVESMLLDQ